MTASVAKVLLRGSLSNHLSKILEAGETKSSTAEGILEYPSFLALFKIVFRYSNKFNLSKAEVFWLPAV